jgi:hypothetical protein
MDSHPVSGTCTEGQDATRLRLTHHGYTTSNFLRAKLGDAMM